MKRLVDINIAVGVLAAFSPLILLTAYLVRIKLGSPVLFTQKRPGLHGKPFTIYKFRTMTEERDEDGELLEDERRLTKFGRFLRSCSLDEFPQLLNVLKGELSIVGPRPLKWSYLALYTPYQARRHEVKPGITGWAQVNGRNAITWEKRFELDVWYVDHRSAKVDAKILWLTIKKVLASDGVSQEGHATMPEFKGSSN
ncbi:sugar transferase [Alteribacillus sp. HJP-4]|uniref:sugar transferase n=1 Tax=Alteribacillus sp. HJP-4 TaxID=2775394 RepID=UPI0035CCFBA3